MADLPSKTVREDEKAAASDNSTAKKKDSAIKTVVSDSALECQGDIEMSRNGNKRKQATLDRYWSKKLHPKKETVREPTTAAVEIVQEASLGHEVEAIYEQASDDNTASKTVAETVETLPETVETLKYGSTPDTDATIEEYDSDSFAASEASAADNLSTSASESSVEHLELGASFDDMPAICETCSALPPLCPSANHTVLFRTDTVDEHCTSIPKPYPDNVVFDEARWDNDHVRLPYSPQNKLLVNSVVVGRWGKIVSSLNSTKWNSSYDIEKAILSYNKYKWDFSELHRYFRTLAEVEHDLFFSQTLPKMVVLAVNLPSICTQPVPLLRKQKAASITMSQQQAASLLANAFFCTFPSRNTSSGSDDDIPHLPSVNFNSLYRRASAYRCHSRHAKLNCLMHYFRRVTTDMPRGTLTFRRQVLVHSPDWANSTAELQKLHVTSDGTVEDNGSGMLQVDFANKFVGGGVLNDGCVQEEIRFLICPELIVSRLVSEELDANESLLVTGCERFSNYTGYGSSTRWLSDHCDGNRRDNWGRLITQIVAIDAKPFRNLLSQLSESSLLRELNKAYCGFHSESDTHAVATGNWGCGAFGGDVRLKAVLQLMAAAQSNRPVCYFTFGDLDLCRQLFQLWESASSANCTISKLWTYINEAAEHLRTKKDGTSSDIYQHIITKCTSSLGSDVS